jgi:hypothetical protein
MKKADMVPKAVTIRKDQDTWLKRSGGHINLSGLLQTIKQNYQCCLLLLFFFFGYMFGKGVQVRRKHNAK